VFKLFSPFGTFKYVLVRCKLHMRSCRNTCIKGYSDYESLAGAYWYKIDGIYKCSLAEQNLIVHNPLLPYLSFLICLFACFRSKDLYLQFQVLYSRISLSSTEVTLYLSCQQNCFATF